MNNRGSGREPAIVELHSDNPVQMGGGGNAFPQSGFQTQDLRILPVQSTDSLRIQMGISGKTSRSNFDVLLTVHLSIILVINQLNAQNLVL